MSDVPSGGHASDVERLHQLGYAQELRRGMRTFSNFAVSFTIISILSGCLTLFGFGMNTGGLPFAHTPAGTFVAALAAAASSAVTWLLLRRRT